MSGLPIADQLVQFTNGIYFMVSCTLLYVQRSKKDNTLQKWLWWLLLLVVLVHIVCLTEYYVFDIFGRSSAQDINMLQLLVVPAATVFIYEITSPGSIRWRHVAACILPFVAMWIFSHTLSMELFYRLDLVMAVATISIMILWAFLKVRAYQKTLYSHYSNTKNRELIWLSVILAEFLALLIVWVLASTFSTQWGDACYNIISCVIWVSLCHYTNRQRVIVFSKRDEDESSGLDESTQTSEAKDAMYHFANDFIKTIEQEKLYLDPDLKLSSLALKLNTNRTYISQYLNSELKTTFYDYINHLRIEHAKRMLQSDPGAKMLVIANSSGYANEQSFYRNFRKYTGMTPSEWAQGKRS